MFKIEENLRNLRVKAEHSQNIHKNIYVFMSQKGNK